MLYSNITDLELGFTCSENVVHRVADNKAEDETAMLCIYLNCIRELC